MGTWVFYDAMAERTLSVLQPDICHAGGITVCRKMAAIGEVAYAKLALHCPLSPLSLAASLQPDAAVPNFLVQEHNEVNDWRENGSTPPADARSLCHVFSAFLAALRENLTYVQ